jgi:hypothetical protein
MRQRRSAIFTAGIVAVLTGLAGAQQHGHADHSGGARYLQDMYGAHVWVTQADWESMERPPAPGRTAPPIPKRDMVIVTANGPHPFVIGWNSYQRFLTVSSECVKGVLVRRADAARAAKS